MRSGGLVAIVAMLAALGGPGAAADAERGEALATRWCGGCHLVGPETSGTDAATPFASLAAPDGPGDGALRAWLAAPHAPMPPLTLGEDEIGDIVAYMRTLAQ